MMLSFPILLLLYFGLLGLSRACTKGLIQNRAVFLLRAFFPSWKLFEDSGFIPILYIRQGVEASHLEGHHWQVYPPKSRARPHSILFNAQGSLALAIGSLLQQVAGELEELSEEKMPHYHHTPTYQLLHQLVRSQIKAAPPAHYQFKVTLSLFSPFSMDVEEATDILVSPPYLYEANDKEERP